jgi:hypothetical protein
MDALERALTPLETLPQAEVAPAPDSPSQSEPAATAPEVEQASPEVSTDTQEVTAEETPRSPRAERRIQDLSKQLRDAKALADEQASQLQSLTQGFAPVMEVDDKALYESGEITLEDYLARRDAKVMGASTLAAQAEVAKLHQTIKEKEFWQEFETDATRLEAANPRFNPSSDQFDQEYVDELSQLYLESFGRTPEDIARAPKLSKFVSSIEKMRIKAENQGRAASTATLAQQASEMSVSGSSSEQPTTTTTRESLRERWLQTGSREDMEAFFKEDARRTIG